MFKLDDFTIINELKMRLDLITQEHVDFLHDTFEPVDPKTESIVGVIPEASRPLWVLSHTTVQEHNMEKTASLSLIDPKLREEHRQRTVLTDQLSDLIRQMMWTQAKLDTGYWAEESIGVRQGWMLVRIPTTESKHVAEMLMTYIKKQIESQSE